MLVSNTKRLINSQFLQFIMANTTGAKGGSATQSYAQMSKGMSSCLDGGIKGGGGPLTDYLPKTPLAPYLPNFGMQNPSYSRPPFIDFEDYLKKAKRESCPRCGYDPACSLPNSYRPH
jgi:hypothetical protein